MEVTKKTWDHVVVSVSGGKDSSMLMLWAKKNFPGHPSLVAVHAEIDIDWKETLPIVKEQCAYLGMPLSLVWARNKAGEKVGFLDKLLSSRRDQKTGELKEVMFPSMAQRWCTSDLKRDPIHRYVRGLQGRILILIGERREESPKRAKLEAYRPHAKLSVKGRHVVEYSPILDMSETQVWEEVKASGMPIHPCYTKFGVKRASCAICIFSSDSDIKQAAIHAPEIVSRYLAVEKKLNHTFRYKPATRTREAQRETIAQILGK